MPEIKPTTSIEVQVTESVQESSPIHILPCQLDYTGPSNVPSFFPQKTELDGWASFRGHALQPSKINVPSGFQLNVVKKQDDDSENYVAETIQNKLTSWERDQPTTYTSNLQKSLNFLTVAHAFAADDKE